MDKCIYNYERRDFNCQVWTENDFRYLTFDNNIIQTKMDLKQKHKLLLEYLNAMVKALYFVKDPKDILLIGLGGGSLIHYLQHYYPHSHITVIEKEDVIIECAQNYFDINKSNHRLKIIAQDVFNYIQNSNDKFDVVLVDACNLNENIIQPLALQQMYISFQSCLKSDGTIAINNICQNQLEASTTMKLMMQVFKNKHLSLPIKDHLNLITIGSLNKQFESEIKSFADNKKIEITHKSLLYGFIAK